MFFHKKAPHQMGCLAVHIGVAVLMLIAAIASLVGLIMAHYDPADGSLIFGTPAASLSIVAFTVTLALLMGQCRNCMSPCDVCAMPTPAKKK